MKNKQEKQDLQAIELVEELNEWLEDNGHDPVFNFIFNSTSYKAIHLGNLHLVSCNEVKWNQNEEEFRKHVLSESLKHLNSATKAIKKMKKK